MSSSPPKVLFLYTELAGYTIACMQALAATGAQIHVVHWPVNEEAPFEFSHDSGIQTYLRTNYDLQALYTMVEDIAPEVMVCSGWIDRDYLSIARAWHKRINTVLALDNHWEGSFRQYLATIAAPFYLRRCFTHCWLPGKPQRKYARRLGFAENRIFTGFYSADVAHFHAIANQYRAQKAAAFPKRFIFVGRYLDFKGIAHLWEAYSNARKRVKDPWELWCIGTGDLYAKRLEAEGITHFGFVQPAQLDTFIGQSGAMVLPSLKEPWGVTVHEFAAAGVPLLLSTKVGAASEFLQHGTNGWLFKAGNAKELENMLCRFMELPTEELLEMGRKSEELALQITPEIWAQTLLNITHDEPER